MGDGRAPWNSLLVNLALSEFIIVVKSFMQVLSPYQLRLSDFDYDLPESLIAQEPSAQRDMSRLMVLDRSGSSIFHCMFHEIERYLRAGDLLVVNDTRVFPCRIRASKPSGGRVEIFLLEEIGRNIWDALVKGGVRTGMVLSVASDMEAEVIASKAAGVRTVKFRMETDIREMLSVIAKTPLPPYIKRDPTPIDQERYQTVYARKEGSVAAPTAGLHFTGHLLERLMSEGVEIVSVTLHVGPGTFQPVRTEFIAEHSMHPEYYNIPLETAERINLAKKQGRRVIAVGTTSVRTLETAADDSDLVNPGEGRSNLFIYPGYRFKVIDGMITNFHLPKSTLLMLVAAFAGRERILSAYRIAAAEGYRFYSYGDAMLII